MFYVELPKIIPNYHTILPLIYSPGLDHETCCMQLICDMYICFRGAHTWLHGNALHNI